MAIFIPRFLRHLRDVDTTGVADGDALTYDSGSDTWVPAAGGSGDLTDAVILAPASSARNVIQPTAGAVIAAIVKAHASQSVDLTQWQLSDGTVLMGIDPAGVVTWKADVTAVQDDLTHVWKNADDDTILTLDSAGQFTVHMADVNGGFTVLGPLGSPVFATGDGMDVLSQAGTPLFAVGTSGTLFLGAGPTVTTGTGSPEGVVSATVGSLYLRTDGGVGTTVYIKESVVTPSTGWAPLGGSSGAPTTATYITQTPDAGLSNEQALSALATGILKSTTGTGVVSIAGSTDYVSPTLFDANTVLAADTDDTPAAVTMGASTILARLAAGNIKAASVAEIITLLQAYTVGGTDVAVTDGGTGASTAATARANLQVPPGRYMSSGLYYNCLPDPVADGQITLTKDLVVYTPFPVHQGFTADRISLGVQAVGTAGAKVRLGIYNDNGSGKPGTLLLDAGTINGDSATYQEITINQALAGGTLYWTAVCWQVQTVGSGAVRGTGVANGAAWYVGKAANNSDIRTANYAEAGITGAFGAATPTTTGATISNPNVRVRVA